MKDVYESERQGAPVIDCGGTSCWFELRFSPSSRQGNPLHPKNRAESLHIDSHHARSATTKSISMRRKQPAFKSPSATSHEELETRNQEIPNGIGPMGKIEIRCCSLLWERAASFADQRPVICSSFSG
jgi:hypothetical protein